MSLQQLLTISSHALKHQYHKEATWCSSERFERKRRNKTCSDWMERRSGWKSQLQKRTGGHITNGDKVFHKQ